MVKPDKSSEARILQAAKKVFITKGMARARMQDIADEAGINKALLHYYFRSKEKLFEVIFRETTARFIPRVNAIMNSDKSWQDKIRLFASDYITTILENPFLPIFVINELNQQPEEFVAKVWGGQKPDLHRFITQIEEAAAQGQIRPIHPSQLLMNMMSLCIFPFIGKPLLQVLSGMNDEQFVDLMEERKTMVPQFIIQALEL